MTAGERLFWRALRVALMAFGVGLCLLWFPFGAIYGVVGVGVGAFLLSQVELISEFLRDHPK
jgi:hypothetical protein